MSDPGPFHDDMTLGEAQQVLRGLVAEGHKCPCCTQFARIYKRKLNSGMAVSLIKMCKAAGKHWQHIPTTIGGRSREEGKLRYWGLVEEAETGGGYWRVTDRGWNFVTRGEKVPMYAKIYDGRCLSLMGELIDIHEALGEHFDLDELMNTV